MGTPASPRVGRWMNRKWDGGTAWIVADYALAGMTLSTGNPPSVGQAADQLKALSVGG